VALLGELLPDASTFLGRDTRPEHVGHAVGGFHRHSIW
jgi:hypothetical protein